MKTWQHTISGFAYGVAVCLLLQTFVLDSAKSGGFNWRDLSPVPIGDKEGAFVVITDDASQRSTVYSRIQADQAYWESLAARGLNYRNLPDEVLEKQNPKLHAAAVDVSLPALLITHDGELLHAGSLPPTTEAIDKIVRKETGR